MATQHPYAGREWIAEGDKIATGREQGILLTTGARHEIAKGYIDADSGRYVLTWENGSGEQNETFDSIYQLSKRLPDATHLFFPAKDLEEERVMMMKFDFL